MASDKSNPSWYEVYNDQTGHLAGIYLPNTTRDSTAVLTTAVQHGQISHILNSFKLRNDSVGHLAEGASGGTGILNVTTPFLSTTCISAVNNGFIDNLVVDIPTTDSPVPNQIGVNIGAVSATNFTGANCTITVRQGHFRKSYCTCPKAQFPH